MLAATFVLGLAASSGEERSRTSFSEEAIGRALVRSVEVPEHGRSRSISFDDDPDATAPTLDDLRARGLAQRQVRVVEAAECDGDGWYLPDMMMPLVWGGEPLADREFQPFHETPDGRTMGWATMETRAVLVAPAPGR